MNSDFITAVIIVGVFFAVLCGIIAESFIREWIAENNMRKFYTGKMEKLMSENWNI